MEKRPKKKMGLWGKYVVLLIVTVILGFMINLFLFVPIPTLADENGWLGFYGSLIGAGIAGIITLWGIEYTIKSTVMNVKPCIRPVKKDFYLYEKKGQGLTITEKPLFHLVEEFASKEKVDMFEVNELVIDAIISKLTEEKGGTEWEHILKNLNRKKMCNLIKEKCAYHTYKDSMEILYRELDKMYRNGVGRVIAERVTEHFCCVMAFEAMSSEKNKWGVFFPIYNTGAGNATDVQIKWDFSKNYHRELCSNLGFTDNEYEDMLKYFSLDTIEVAEAEVMLNTNGDNIFRVQVPGEVLLLIENLYLKKIKNCKEEKYENNNALVGEHKFAELYINCKDIYGENHYFDYCVMFLIQPTMWKGYGYQEERFYLKFDNAN